MGVQSPSTLPTHGDTYDYEGAPFTHSCLSLALARTHCKPFDVQHYTCAHSILPVRCQFRCAAQFAVFQ